MGLEFCVTGGTLYMSLLPGYGEIQNAIIVRLKIGRGRTFGMNNVGLYPN